LLASASPFGDGRAQLPVSAEGSIGPPPPRSQGRRMNARCRICAVVPIKETAQAKQRLAGVLSAEQRRQLALAMAEDVLATLASIAELVGIVVVTTDPTAAAIAAHYGARVTADGAGDGQTAAVAAAARQLLAQGLDLLALPGDIPLVEPADIMHLLAVHQAAPAFTIVPARDQNGSNAVLCSPADVVPLRFGLRSFVPHLAAARAHGIEPLVVRLPRIALDVDEPKDLALFRRTVSRTRARALLDRWSIRDEASAADDAQPGA
jgi:2-phospho-L-lactate guanylyltransferase